MEINGKKLVFRQTGFELLERTPGEKQFIRAENVVSIQRVAGRKGDVRDVTRRERQVFVRALSNNEGAPFQFQSREQAFELFGLRRFEFKLVHKDNVTCAKTFGNGFAK